MQSRLVAYKARTNIDHINPNSLGRPVKTIVPVSSQWVKPIKMNLTEKDDNTELTTKIKEGLTLDFTQVLTTIGFI